ncbi:unnamed protein product [Tetraodon nigroviridis]|uniref:(spotted green pufferfish) hypothetical protein n=1 Tax=Tetraodon nigroviridis TaxID=99883 RepID=Q4RQQ2_TETNG|nr:unnamed protein product [Tetraodon nigroviridis]
MAERTSSGLLTVMLESTPAVGVTLPAEVREKLAELELELSEGECATARTGAHSSCWRGKPPPFTVRTPPLVESFPFLNFCSSLDLVN